MPESDLNSALRRPVRRLPRRRARGFTMTELAVVLMIVALLLGGLLVPLGTQQEMAQRKATATQLNTIREALLSYLLVNGQLPCPDYDNNPAAAGYGIEDAGCHNWAGAGEPATEGFLPWKTLGVAEFDAWGSAWQNAADPRLGHWRYRIERDYADSTRLKTLIMKVEASLNLCDAATSPFPKDCLAIVDTAGQTLYAQKERPLALVYSVGPNGRADGNNDSYEANKAQTPTYQADTPSAGFDDQLIWLTRNNLVAALVAVGRLP